MSHNDDIALFYITSRLCKESSMRYKAFWFLLFGMVLEFGESHFFFYLTIEFELKHYENMPMQYTENF